MLETTEADAVPPDQALHVKASEVLAIVINQATLDAASDYKVTRPGKTDAYEFEAQRQPGGKILMLTPKDGKWLSGQHLVDVPSGGMFDTSRLYYTFVIDEETP